MLRSKSRDSLRFHCKFGQKSGRPKWGRNELFSRLGKSRFLDGKGQLPARARVGFWGWKDGEPSSSLPSLKRGGGARKRRGPDHGSWMCGFGLARAREMFLGPEGRRDLVISFFSPRIRADMPAALVLTEEN